MTLEEIERWHKAEAQSLRYRGEVEAAAWHEGLADVAARSVEIHGRTATPAGRAFALEEVLEASAALSADGELTGGQRALWQSLNEQAARRLWPEHG